MSKFKKGDKVICTNRDQDIRIGEVFIVDVPKAPCCGGISLIGCINHYEEENFEIASSDAEPKYPSGYESEPDDAVNASDGVVMIEKKCLFAGLDLIIRPLLFASQRAYVPVEMIRDSIWKFVIHLGVSDDYSKYIQDGK